jgi:hypothetical protein
VCNRPSTEPMWRFGLASAARGNPHGDRSRTVGFLDRLKGQRSPPRTTNQYLYPSAPFREGEDVIATVDPDDRDVVMIFGKA